VPPSEGSRALGHKFLFFVDLHWNHLCTASKFCHTWE